MRVLSAFRCRVNVTMLYGVSRTLLLGLAGMMILSLSGERLHAQARTDEAHMARAQLIVKFRSADANAADPGFLQQLSKAAGAGLTYVRPMSGGAHVLRLTDPVDASEIKRIVERLAKHPDVEYAELDRLLEHMSP